MNKNEKLEALNKLIGDTMAKISMLGYCVIMLHSKLKYFYYTKTGIELAAVYSVFFAQSHIYYNERLYNLRKFYEEISKEKIEVL